MRLSSTGVGYQFFDRDYQASAHNDAHLSDVYKMMIDISGEQERVFVFHGVGCRKGMLEWYYGYLDKRRRGNIATIILYAVSNDRRPDDWASGGRSVAAAPGFAVPPGCIGSLVVGTQPPAATDGARKPIQPL